METDVGVWVSFPFPPRRSLDGAWNVGSWCVSGWGWAGGCVSVGEWVWGCVSVCECVCGCVTGEEREEMGVFNLLRS